MGIDGVGDQGTVVVSAALSIPSADAWRALTDPEVVQRWFGKLSGPLTEGGSSRLDFEDGDFFDIFDVDLQPVERIHYRWSFLGTSSPDSITWRIFPEDIGCVVAVIDFDSERNQKWIAMLKAGWLDFVQRLVDHTRTGQTTRYDWRRDFDGTVDLPGTSQEMWARLFDNSGISAWAPFLSDGVSENAECRPNDGLEPAVARVTRVTWEPPKALHFDITHPQWAIPTSVDISLSQLPRGVMLSVSHTGWELLQCNPAYSRQQRKRFADLWVSALSQARKAFAVRSADSPAPTETVA
jgi:uncharacterized protein YndB with AHSA1/START domain